MSRLLNGVVWTVIGVITLIAVWLTLPWHTIFALGLVAGVAVGGLHTATSRLSGETLSTVAVVLSTGTIIATVSVVLISARWLPAISTATLGYAVGIVAAWLLVSGVSLDELGSFAAIAGLVLVVVGGAAGLLSVADSLLFLAVLFAGLLAGFLVPISGLVAGVLQSNSAGPRRSTDDETINPATRFGIEATVIAGLAVAVPFGSRGVALFGHGGLGGFPVGLGCGVVLSVGISKLGRGHSERLDRLRNRFVELVYRLVSRIENWVERRRSGSQQSPDDTSAGDGDGESIAASPDDEGSLSTASTLIDGAAGRLADRELVIEAAERLDTMTTGNSGLHSRMGVFWGRLSGAAARDSLTSGAILQLSAAEEAQTEGNAEKAQSRTDAALELAAPTIGSVAAAIVRGRPQGAANILDTLAPLLARIDSLLAEEKLPEEPDDPDQFQLIQLLLERLVSEEDSEGFDSALSTIRAAAADGWYSVQAGDQALSKGNYQRALLAYLGAIEAYRRAYDIATDAEKTATRNRKQPGEETGDRLTTDGDQTVTAAAETYASESTRVATAIEALLHDTAAVTIAAIEDLYGEHPPPTVDTDVRRTIVRVLRTSRQTRTRIDATVPPVDLANDRYQQAEIARSVARIRRHLSTADEAAAADNVESAAEQYDRAADRLDVLSNRAGNNGLIELARSLTKAGVEIGTLASKPTPEAVANRPKLAVPSTTDRRAPEVAPAGRRLRRTFCRPAFVALWEFTDDAGAHEILDIAGEPYPELVGSVGMALSSLDPLYTDPDIDSLLGWVSETALDVLSATVETLSERHSTLVDVELPPPPAFREPPEVLQDGSVTTVPTADGVDVFSEAWLSRATELAKAKAVIDRRQSAVDGFAALEPKVRERLKRDGKLDSSQVSAELLVVAAHHLTGVEYDLAAERLSKTGEIGRRDPAAEEPAEDPQSLD